MLNEQTRGTPGVQRPHALIETASGPMAGPEPSGREDRGIDTRIPYGATPPDPLRRLLEALAVYEVTRPDFGERVDRTATLH